MEAEETRSEELQRLIFQLRKNRLKDREMNYEKFKETLMSKSFLDARLLEDSGMIDGVGYYRDFKKAEADNAGELIVSLPPGRTIGNSSGMRTGSFRYLMNNRFLVQ